MSAEERAAIVLALEHDVRQPQHSIEMGLRALRLLASDVEMCRDDEGNFSTVVGRLRAELASVSAAIRQIIDTQQDLIDAIRLECDNTSPAHRDISADDLLEHVWRANRGIADRIELRRAQSSLTFVSDERLLQRILNNLVANALRHSEGTRVFFGARRYQSGIAFEVRDNGKGMPRDRVASVFDIRSAQTLSPIGYSSARSGLGLYNVRLLTERLNGAVECCSALGRGTRFRVFLPGPVGRVERQPKPVNRTVVLAARNKLVAILDDDLAVLRSTEKLFHDLGIEVYADHDPIRWLSVVTDLERRPDLILIADRLGQQDCSLQLDIVRRRWGVRGPSVILVTRHARSARRCVGEMPVLQKPLTGDKLEYILGMLATNK
jgi:hypothetical protein